MSGRCSPIEAAKTLRMGRRAKSRKSRVFWSYQCICTLLASGLLPPTCQPLDVRSRRKGTVVSVRKSPPPPCCLQTLTFREAGGASPSGIWKKALAKGTDNVLPPLHYHHYLWGQIGFLPPAHGPSSCPHPLFNVAHSALSPSSTSSPKSTLRGLVTRREQRIWSQESASFLTLP